MAGFVFPVPSLGRTVAAAALSCLKSVTQRSGFLSRILNMAEPSSGLLTCGDVDCRVQLLENNDRDQNELFRVEIRGSIQADDVVSGATAQISAKDITSGPSQAAPVRLRSGQTRPRDDGDVIYSACLGRFPSTTITIPDWLSVAEIEAETLVFPHKGPRQLLFEVRLLAGPTGKPLAFGRCVFCYENKEIGYLQLQQNTRRAKTLAVALAFAVSAADSRLYRRQIELIKNWARNHIDISPSHRKASRTLEKALNTTVEFFCSGNTVDMRKICEELAEIAPLKVRYDILQLCLEVAAAGGSASAEQLAVLKALAEWLEADPERFRAMAQAALPAGGYRLEDAELILGVSGQMNGDQARKVLNDQYRKWNSRVTCSDAEVRAQADQMLTFIAEARGRYVG